MPVIDVLLDIEIDHPTLVVQCALYGNKKATTK